MQFDYLDKKEYVDIRLLRMIENNHGDLPFFIRKYNTDVQDSTLHRHGSESHNIFDRHRDAIFNSIKYINENYADI